ncbi:hypothetical protein VMCG_07706 [Cytospora schulzeri]|uniref:RanBD1 domain-containing protein n=1 Tax=Cytospora schulzeri TaxID=448051 RepID=A0A423VYY8_9PEZI|nr:hypothetical protein VMCG_07706 [Valsa malicola]
MDSSSRQRGPTFSFRAGQASTSSSFPSYTSKLRHEVNEDGRAPPRPMGSWRTTGPASKAQPAASTVMAGRRIFDRSQNMSRLGLSTTRPASNVPATTPGRIFNRPGLTNGTAPKFHFSPRIPANTMRESFPAATPGRSFRGSTADINGRAMSKTAGSNLFPMRISSPPPELDGEELAKQVPNNPNRVGSVYADEYLSHLVPPELDDLQRRQFLCILDLRRLKYAATEIFSKKDWRVNIMNFGKEYEKSRSLIMLRYGLYEFKTVPASREVLQKWKQENNVPEEDEEMDEAPVTKPNGISSNSRGSTKRRAEDDLTKDSDSTIAPTPSKRRVADREPLAESSAMTSNAGATPFVKKVKRGAEHLDELDENQPSKKKSSTLSIFEDVTNKSPTRPAASPTKPAPKNIFAQPAKTSESTLSGGFKAPPSGNIFGHLSGQNSPDGSDDEEGSEAESENGAEEEAAPAVQPAASTTTSLFGAKPSAFTSDSSTTGSALSKAPSLFDRITKGTDGEAARTTEDKPADQQTSTGLFSSIKRPASPAAESQPQNKTWNPNTPIKFGATTSQPGTSLFGAKTSESTSIFANKPAENTGFKFGSTEASKADAAPAFGTQVQDFAKEKEAPKTAAPSLFGQAAKPSEPTTSLFGNVSKTPIFGQKSEEPKPADSTVPPATPSLFGTQSNVPSTTPFGNPPTTTPSTQGESKSIFASLNTPATTAQTTTPSLFGTANNDKPSSFLFGAKSDDKPPATPAFGGFGTQSSTTPSLFGAKTTAPAEEKKEESAPKRKKPDSDEAAAVFGSGLTDQPSKKFSFGGGAPTSTSLPPKTPAAANGADDAGSIFGATSQEGPKTYSFGSTASTTPAPATPKPAETPAPVSLFGNTTSQPEAAKTQPSIFANTTTPSTGFTFGAGASTTPASNLFGGASNTNNTTDSNQPPSLSFGGGGAPASNSFTFNSGGGDQGSFKNPFASGTNASATPSFDFGNTQSQTANAPFTFGGPSTSTIPPTSSFTFGGGSQPATSAPASNSFTFGGDSQTTNNASAPSSNMFGGTQPNGGSSMFSFSSQAQSQPTSNMFSAPPANAAQGIFASNLAPPPGSSTGTNTPLFGGASSIATTPANGTPEPEAAASKKVNADEKTADEDGKPQEQISLTDGGPGEEDEEVVHEVRAKALRLVPSKADDDDKDKKSTSNWKTEGLGPLRVLKHKTTGAVRILLRAEPRGNIAMNKLVLADFDYKVDKGAKWVKVPCAKDDGQGLETWMLQVKTNEFAVKLAGAMEENKTANKK